MQLRHRINEFFRSQKDVILIKNLSIDIVTNNLRNPVRKEISKVLT